jgi:hypothetical protein
MLVRFRDRLGSALRHRQLADLDSFYESSFEGRQLGLNQAGPRWECDGIQRAGLQAPAGIVEITEGDDHLITKSYPVVSDAVYAENRI